MSYEDEALGFCQGLDLLLAPLSLGSSGFFESSKIPVYIDACANLANTGVLHEDKMHITDVHFFTMTMIELGKAMVSCPAIGGGQDSFPPDEGTLDYLMYKCFGYTLIYDDHLIGNSDQYLMAFAAVSGMKFSSFKTTVSANNIQVEDLACFAQSRRGFIPLEMVDSTASIDRYKIPLLPETAIARRYLERKLVRRAKDRNIDTLTIMKTLNVSKEEDLVNALTSFENLSTVAELLSLDLIRLLKVIEQIEREEFEDELRESMKVAQKERSKVDGCDLLKDESVISPQEFASLLKQQVNTHPKYRNNKKMVAFLTESGVEIAVELTTVKTINLWINSDNLTKNLRDSATTRDYAIDEGRHSGLYMYPQLGEAAVTKITFKTAGQAKRIIGELR